MFPSQSGQGSIICFALPKFHEGKYTLPIALPPPQQQQKSHYFCLCFIFVWRPHPAVIRAHSLLCAQRSLLVVFRVVVGIEQGLAAWKANALFPIPSLRLKNPFIKLFNLGIKNLEQQGRMVKEHRHASLGRQFPRLYIEIL